MPCPEPRGEAMSRRVGTAGRAAKKLPRKSAKLRRRRNAEVRSALSAADLQEQVGTLTHELEKAREQQTATAGVLNVISGSTFSTATSKEKLLWRIVI
jgi:hypothetical protein